MKNFVLIISYLIISNYLYSQNQYDLINQYNHFREEGQFQEAINTMSKLIKIDSTNDSYYYHRAMDYSFPRINKMDSAIADLNFAIHLNDTSVIYHFYRGSFSWGRDPKSAVQDFEKTIQLDSNFYDGYEKLHTYFIYRDVKKAAQIRKIAQRHFLKLVNSDSLNSEYWFLLGKAYDLLDDYIETKTINEKSLSAYSKAITLNPNNVEYYWQRGTKYFFYKKDYEACLNDMLNAIKLKNDRYLYYLYVAICYEEKGDIKDAMETIDKAIALFPDNEMLKNKKADILKKSKK